MKEVEHAVYNNTRNFLLMYIKEGIRVDKCHGMYEIRMGWDGMGWDGIG